MPAGAAQSSTDMSITMLPMIPVVLLAMWFLQIRPAMKRQKEQDQLRKTLKRGDRVLTQAGFYGEVDHVAENGNVFLRVAGEKVEFQPQAIVSKVEGA